MSSLPATYVEGFHSAAEASKMKYVDFGSTGLKVSALGFGGACFGQHYGTYDVEDAAKVVREALRRGVNYVDTAPFYGEGRSETTLGVALRGLPRSSYYLATKVARYATDPARAFDFSRESVLASVDESLKRLAVDYVDVIQVHDVEFAPSADVVVNETIPALQEVVRSGKARFIGVTGYPVSRLKTVVEKSNRSLDAILSYARLTLMDDTLNDYLPYFKSRGLAVIHASPPAMGLLTNAGSRDWHPGNRLYRDVCTAAGQYCKDRGVELGNLAVHHAMSQSGVDVHLIGMPTIPILEANLRLATRGADLRELEVLREVADRFFKPGDKLHWENIELEQYKKELANLAR